MGTRKIGSVNNVPEEVFFASRFVCPRCGDSKFGSMMLPDESLRRTCHGDIDGKGPCFFTWHESDDHLYCFVPLRFLEAALAKRNNEGE
ncbi:hypothetical protein SAMN05421681_103352 [Lysobacter enzymogenes]|nr:hypothetical protein SAMN05421681_103352 [Lysobacter enzymogenes]